MSGARSDAPRSLRHDLVVVALASMVQLSFEMLVIKLGRYELGSLAIGTIGLALLGVSLAGPLTAWLGGPERAARRAMLAVLPIATLVGAHFFSRAHSFRGEGHAYRAMLACGLAALVLLALTAVPVFVALRRHGASVPRVYAASLAGATLGAPATLLAMHTMGDVGAFAGVLGLTGVVAALVVPGARERVGVLACTAALVATCAVGYPRLDRAAHEGAILIATDATSRIDVHERPGGRLQIRTAGVNAGTSTAGGTVAEPPVRLIAELSAHAFHLRPAEVLILGSGAGKNVVQALHHGARHVVAVEINPMIPRALAELLPAAADPYRDERVELLVAEGREAAAELAHAGRRFDLVYVPIATLFGSSGHAFTETYLMTEEAFARYADALAPGGTLGVYFPSVVRAKVVSAMARALASRGVRTAADHLVVVEKDGGFLLLARPDAAFDRAERARIVGSDALEVAVEPEIAEGRRARALSDDNPFLYNDLASARGARALYGWNLRFLRESFWVALGLLALATLSVVLRRRAAPMPTRLGTLAAFVTMGIAYTAHQTLVLQRLAFLVGHPVTATAIVLPMTLLGSAVGAQLAAVVSEASRARLRLVGLGVWVAATLPLVLLAPDAFVAPGLSTPARIAAAALLAGVPFVPLGSYFPVAFARVEAETPSLANVAWWFNGLGAVLGAVVAIYAPMLFGFRSTCWPTFAAYAALTAWDTHASRRGTARAAHLGLAAVVVLLLASVTYALEHAAPGISH